MTISNKVKFGTDGIRGKYGEILTPNLAYCLGKAAAEVLGVTDEFIVGRDTRYSGPILAEAIIAGLKASGAKAKDIGIIPTPGLAVISKRENIPAIVITASHNPAEDNGIKIFGHGGTKITAPIESKLEELLERYLNSEEEYVPQSVLQSVSEESSYEYLRYLEDKSSRVDLKGLKIVLDCANGAAYFVGPEAFKNAGAEVFAINTESDGKKINDNCGATHLEDLSQAVVSYKADIGFAYDGDADRVMAVDNEGKVIDGDYILALFALDMNQSGLLKNNTLVATSMSNGALKIFMEKNGIHFKETDVGDKYVLAAMKENDFSLGGEQSGHIIRTDKEFWGDGILNSLLIAAIFSAKKKNDSGYTSSQLFDLFDPMVQLHTKVKVPNKSKIADSTEIEVAKEKALDSLGENSRVIIRPSGTEEVVRITVESQDDSVAQQVIDDLADQVLKICS